jgi:hypothetical protein
MTLRPLAPELWVADRPLPLPVGDIGTRMTVIRLGDGGLFLHSPVRLDATTRTALAALGPVRAVVAPNKVHHLFAGDYAAAYPEARLYAAPGLPEKRPDLPFHETLADQTPLAWHLEIEQHVFRGIPWINEVVFFHRATRTLLLTDLAFNVGDSGRGRARLFYWLTGVAGRFGPTRILRALLRDRHTARTSVETILAWDFDRVVVAHGAVLESGGREAVRAAFAFL